MSSFRPGGIQVLSSPAVTPSPGPPSWGKRGSRDRGESREDWRGGPSIPAGSARHGSGDGSGRGPETQRSAPPLPVRGPAPLPGAVVASAGGVGKGKWLAALGVPPGSVAILVTGGGGSASREPLLSVAPQERRHRVPEPRWSPRECQRAPRSAQPRTVPKWGRSPFCWGTKWVESGPRGPWVTRSAQSPPHARSPTPTLSPLPKEAGQRQPESAGLFTGDQGHLPGLLPTHGVSRLTKGRARLRQVRPSQIVGRGSVASGLTPTGKGPRLCRLTDKTI